MRDDLDQGSYAAMLANHWASHTPDKYKFAYADSVLFYMRPHSREIDPNYSVGTRAIPYAGDQRIFDGSHRGSGLY